jgi:hypothetical protein
MVKIDDFDDEFVSEIRDATADHVSLVREKSNVELPVREIYVPKNNKIIKKSITWPSRILRSHTKERTETLRPVAEWIEANPSQSYRWEQLIGNPLDDKQPTVSDHVPDPNRQHLIDTFERDLSELAQEIVNYTGRLEWTEDAFERAAEEFLVDTSSQGPLGNISKNFTTLFPLVDFELNADSIELAPDIPLVERQDGEWIAEIKISEITDEELATLYTHDGSRTIGDKRFGKTTHAIKVTSNGSPHASNDDQVRAAIVTALRLFKPHQATVHADRGYRLEEKVLNHREGIFDVVGGMLPMSTPGTPYYGDEYRLDSSEAKVFEDFWEIYNSELNTELDSNIGRALRRFNYVHQRGDLEDRLVDSAIALEGTLLRDVNPGSSLTFRLRLRSGMLLDGYLRYDRKTIRDLFRALYIARGDIVHSDRQIDEIIDNQDRFDLFEQGKPNAEEFVQISQILLSKTLLRYIVEKVENGKSITEINREMDVAALNAERR